MAPFPIQVAQLLGDLFNIPEQSMFLSALCEVFLEQLGQQGFLFCQGSLIARRPLEFCGLCFQGSPSGFGEGRSGLFDF